MRRSRKQIKTDICNAIQVKKVPKRDTTEWHEWIWKYDMTDFGSRVWCQEINTYWRGEPYYVLINGDLYDFER